jgi:cell division protein FtsI (penicillin-binding protein 3)
MVVILMAFGLLVGRLTYVQVVAGDRYAAFGMTQLLHTVYTPASRGSLLDRSGHVLAISVLQPTIVADPHLVTDPVAEAGSLAPALGMDQLKVLRLLDRNADFVYLAREVDSSVGARVQALHLPGISVVHEPKGFQTDGPLASSLLGSVGVDGRGLSGLEYQYDGLLSGKPGKTVLERGPDGADIPGGVRSAQPARAGQSIELTLDQPLQYATEQALSNEIVTAKAKGGVAIVMSTRTGDILAMANLTAGQNGAPPKPSLSNAAVTSVYEPGSVIKGVIFAGAIEDRLISPSTTFSVPDQVSVAGSTFHDAESHGIETLSATDILAQSSNVGTIGIAEMMGKQRISNYLRAFGFGSFTGLRYPGESPGLLVDPSKWSGTAIAAVPIGQDEAVTPLQLLDAYNTIGNGGVSVTPRLARATVDPNGASHPLAPEPGHRVVSPRTTREMTSMLEQVVQSPQGTGTAAAIPGYTVAGKTGTAQKPLANGRGYQPGAYMATFAGFAPAADPAVTAVVVLDQPTPIFGGAVAAPVFSQVVKYALRQLEIAPGTQAAQSPVVSPGTSPQVRTTD